VLHQQPKDTKTAGCDGGSWNPKRTVWMPNPSLSERVPQRKAGEPFNPCRRACGFSPADIISQQRDLGDGPKRLYERMVRWAGDKGTCWYSYERMAAVPLRTSRI
jgi:hypothetical protein